MGRQEEVMWILEKFFVFVVSFLRNWIRAYPKQPLIYVCTHNGVTGVVRAEDFDNEILRMRREFTKNMWPVEPLGWEIRPVRPQVYPVFLFSDKNPQRSFRVGTLAEMTGILKGCCVEERNFELPPLNAPGMAKLGYYGSWEEVGRENTRHRVWTLKQAHTHLSGGIVNTYDL